MKRLALLALLTAPAQAQTSPPPAPVPLTLGVTEITLQGEAHPLTFQRYRFPAQKGQELHIRLLSASAAPRFQLAEPDSIPLYDSQNGATGPEYDGLTPQTGTYEIRVFLPRNNNSKNVPFTLVSSLR
ncbi:hypothetical protein [Kozakia baliensis]|uniref:hypothetical protein n=1 Tax=Kozakia baliensis TaxID=153496 RepID=UPI000879ADEC|nr:hypothetical protein [Kozakia baliensis]AOX20338.1 hypothetical protein A0U90_08540 [Kozakia baliensis]